MRDNVLKRWVEQPTVGSNIQYLRDAERVRAWEQLGTAAHVLDVASESNVTKELDADHVTRLDFSADAIDHARDLLGDRVDHYEWVSPEQPDLPFEDDAFDAVISIGPYDWKFLDIHRLTSELHRVIQPDGRFVVSVPTIHSPYSVRSRKTNRYYTPREALELFAPDWQTVDYDLLFQYPFFPHKVINSLPDRYQAPFVDVAWRLTETLTENEWWNLASYLVLSMEPLDFETTLDDALDRLFRPLDDYGFWNEEDGMFVRARTYELDDEDNAVGWSIDDHEAWQYTPLALMGVLQWRTSQLATDAHDDRIRRACVYLRECISDPDMLDTMSSYGVGPLIGAFARAATVFDDDFHDTAVELFHYSKESFDFVQTVDALLLCGWASFFEWTADETVAAELLSSVEDGLWTVAERMTPEGLFAFENETSRQHQHQMYVVWGLARAIQVTGMTGYLDSIERVLDYTIEKRMRDDGAFLREDISRRQCLKRNALARLGLRPRQWKVLDSSRQTFFVNAVAAYYRAGGKRRYDEEVRRAMGWTYGNSLLDCDLSELSSIGAPTRHLTINNEREIPDQNVENVDEIGSFVMALTDLCVGPLTRETRKPRPMSMEGKVRERERARRTTD